MGQSVEVVTAQLHAASLQLADAAQHLKDGLAGVDDEVHGLLATGWKGGAASAYAPQWERWHEGATNVVEGLQRMSELLDVAGREYGRTDESAAGGLDATMQGSGGSSGSGGGGTTGGGAGAGSGGAAPATPSGAADPTGSGSATGSNGSAGSGGSAGSTGSAGSGGSASEQILQEAVSAAQQLGGAAGQPLTQAAQALAAAAAQAAQVATELAGETDEKADGSETDPDRAGESSDAKADGSDSRPETQTPFASSASGDQTAGTAPVRDVPAEEAPPARLHADPTPGTVARPLETGTDR